jgi:hypothetical protein
MEPKITDPKDEIVTNKPETEPVAEQKATEKTVGGGVVGATIVSPEQDPLMVLNRDVRNIFVKDADISDVTRERLLDSDDIRFNNIVKQAKKRIRDGKALAPREKYRSVSEAAPRVKTILPGEAFEIVELAKNVKLMREAIKNKFITTKEEVEMLRETSEETGMSLSNMLRYLNPEKNMLKNINKPNLTVQELTNVIDVRNVFEYEDEIDAPSIPTIVQAAYNSGTDLDNTSLSLDDLSFLASYIVKDTRYTKKGREYETYVAATDDYSYNASDYYIDNEESYDDEDRDPNY